jgi:hypothetical protein
MASMAPIAGAQYRKSLRKPTGPSIVRSASDTDFIDWVSEFAPDKYQKFLSYTTGYKRTVLYRRNLH